MNTTHDAQVLRAFADEIRLQVHLAGMDLKTRWNELEPQLLKAERVARDAGEAAGASVKDVVAAARALRDQIIAEAKRATKPGRGKP
jgi:hypothetical protein